MALTSVPRCKAFRGIPSDNQEHDAELERLIVSAQDFLERKCERKFEQATVTEYFNGGDLRDRTWLMVARPPIVSITNIWDDVDRVYATPLASTNYVIEDAETGVIRLDGLKFLDGIRNVKLTYSGGSATIPTALEEAIIEMVWAAREKGLHNLVGVRSRSIADGNVQYVNLSWDSIADEIVKLYSLHLGVA